MRLDRLSLKGITCFAEPVDLDFTQIPPGLIAIVGENGSGKTTLMEAPAAAIYGDLPTRGSVAKYATDKDSYIDVRVTFDQGGAVRARRNIDGVKGVQDATLERDGQALNDGKVTTFKTAVEGIFPTLDTLLASSLAVQNRKGSFATRNRTDRKDLFYALLGLGRLERFATTCRSAAAVIDKRLAELRGRMETLTETAGDEQHRLLEGQANALHVDLNDAEIAKRSADEALAAADAELARLRADVEAKAAVITERATLEAQLRECGTRRSFYDTQDEDLQKSIADQRKAIEGRLSSALRRINDAIGLLVTDEHLQAQRDATVAKVHATRDELVNERQARIDKNQSVIDRAPDIRRAAAEARALTADLATLRVKLATTRQELEHARPSASSTGEAVREAEAALAELFRLQRSATLLASVPCGGAAEFASCQFLKDAAEARDRAAGMDEAALRQAVERAEAKRDDQEAAVAAAQSAVAFLQGEIDQHDARVDALAEYAALLPHLEAAEGKIADYERDIAEAKAAAERGKAEAEQAYATAVIQRDDQRARLAQEVETTKADSQQELADLETKTAETRTQRAADRASNEAESGRLMAELAKTADAAEQHQSSVAALATHESERSRLADVATGAATTFVRLEEQVTHLRARRVAFDRSRAQWEAAKAGVKVLEDALLEWQLLAQMLGREGLPVLEIDGAGPGVSDGANDLLQASYDGRFAVELITQDVKADGKGMKEVFELKVYDHERGGEARDLSDLSGGEQVIVDSALRLAIALWMNRRNEQPIRTVWLDETTGALDPDNAQRYLSMLRRLHERAGLHHLIFVSHNPDVSNQADAQIQVADGKATVAFAPFTAEEAA